MKSGFLLVPPTASLRLGPTLKPETIKEGDDVYFECAISANPDVNKLIWKHEARRDVCIF